MAVFDKLDCTVYVEHELGSKGLVTLLQDALPVTKVESGPGGTTLYTADVEMEVRGNDDADDARAVEFPNGFLYFSHTLELYFSPTAQHADGVKLVAQILQLLWSHGLPAVAACDYEDELPQVGGYDNPSVPWPGKVASRRQAIAESKAE